MSPLADMVRRRDPDRFFTALFAPEAARDALLTLYAFNIELARAQDLASTPALALIRLQWWREIVEGAERRHEVASPLRALLAEGRLPPAPLVDMIAARESDVEEMPATMAAFTLRLLHGPGALAAAAGGLLGATEAEKTRLRHLGAAYGAAGTLRNVAALAGRQRCVLPLDVLAQAGFVPEVAFAAPDAVRAAVTPSVAAPALEWLGRPRPMRRAIIAAALPGVLARRDLARAAPASPRGFIDRLAVAWAATRCVA
jgi:phytoene synthase